MHKDLLVKGKFLPGHWDSWLAEILDEPHSNLKGSYMTVSIWLKCMRKTKMLSAASFLSEAHGTAKPFFNVRSWRTWKALNWMLSITRSYRNTLLKLKNPIQSLRPVTALTPQQVRLQWSMVGQNFWSLALDSPQVLFGRHEKDPIPNLDHAAKILNSLLLHHWRSEEGYQYNISKISIWNFLEGILKQKITSAFLSPVSTHRFQILHMTTQLPQAQTVPSWGLCGRCWPWEPWLWTPFPSLQAAPCVTTHSPQRIAPKLSGQMKLPRASTH